MASIVAVELASFTLADGVSEVTLLDERERLKTDFLAKTDGYLGRMLVKNGHKRWADIVYWQSTVQAEKAMEHIASSEVGRRYFTCMATGDHDDLAHAGPLIEVSRRSDTSVVRRVAYNGWHSITER